MIKRIWINWILLISEHGIKYNQPGAQTLLVEVLHRLELGRYYLIWSQIAVIVEQVDAY